MTDCDFSVKYAWFVAESDVVEKFCIDCREPFTVCKKQGGHKTRCDRCQAEYEVINDKQRYVAKNSTGDSVCNLALAVIRQAQRERDIEFLADGAPLWLRATGLNLQPSMIERLAHE